LEIDGLDEQPHHMAIFNEIHNPIATARLTSKGEFGRMVVLKGYRGRGIGHE
jgi:predicted GNAT family N-acyltransferase